ncbi:putative Histone deacetylase 6 [Hypsibius exemplaris]|uniref:Histone deacetylase 6 n=1 Tax=Hypsibius exemplaris TaxID=2072580 RepID=A0A1W0WDC5_HYPEX|nr:putative Histone deacetylase 6 [Hypsibius exemplaris]
MEGGGPSGSHAGDQPLPASAPIRFYGVVPRTVCDHLTDNVQPIPPAGLCASDPCGSCGDTRENWLCLKCYQVHCSRHVNGDAQRHRDREGHELVLSYADLSVWCFACDSYINNPITHSAKQAAYLSKFGEMSPEEAVSAAVSATDADVER